jgi:hypothetical protein
VGMEQDKSKEDRPFFTVVGCGFTTLPPSPSANTVLWPPPSLSVFLLSVLGKRLITYYFLYSVGQEPEQTIKVIIQHPVKVKQGKS